MSRPPKTYYVTIADSTSSLFPNGLKNKGVANEGHSLRLRGVVLRSATRTDGSFRSVLRNKNRDETWGATGNGGSRFFVSHLIRVVRGDLRKVLILLVLPLKKRTAIDP